MSIYELQKTLGGARTAVQALTGQMDSIKKDVAGGGPDAAKRGDALATRLSELQTDINRLLNSAGTATRPIESFSGLPTADQQRQIDWLFEDAKTAVDGLNRLIQTEIPGMYTQFAKREWPNRIQPIPPIKR